MVANVEIKVLVPGFEKLVDVVASGVGSIAGSMLGPWMAKREGQARLIQAESEAKALTIQAQAQAEARRLLVADHRGLVSGEIEVGDAVRQRIEFQERKRQANIAAAVNHAALELYDTQVPAEEPDHDWTARFFGEVQDVSSEGMQLLWGRVLAGEVRKSGTTSKRTLGILKDLDADTAELFSRLCSAAVYLVGGNGQIFDGRVPSLGQNAGQNALQRFGLGFGALNRLNEHGLIIADYNSFNIYEVVDGPRQADHVDLLHQGVRWECDIQEKVKKSVSVKLHGVAITVAGCELSRVVSQEPLPKYTEALKRFLHGTFQLRMRHAEGAGADVG